MLSIGEVSKFKVLKETDIAYMLKSVDDPNHEEVFLHFNQCKNRLSVGEIVDCFLYYDQKKRLCATTETPLISSKKGDFVPIIDVFGNMGVFINIGIAKDILLSSDYLPLNKNNWPQVGDVLPCIIQVKSHQLTAKIASKFDLPKEKNKLEVNQKVEAIVYKYNNDGINLITKDYNQIFVHKNLTRQKIRLGEKLTVKIININEKGYYNGSLIENKEVIMFDDAKTILNYLEKQGGILHLSDKSTPEEINHYFQMSKKAFKRAIGSLYANHLIEIFDDKIKLK